MAFKKKLEIIIGPEGGEGVLITDLFMTFEISKSDTESLNTASVKIYNLSRETEEKICIAGNKIVIRAGYEDEGISSLFFGNIIKAGTSKEKTERLLTIEAQDGEKVYTTKKTALSFKAGTKAYVVADSIFNLLAMPVFGKENINKNIEYTIGYSFIGMAKSALSDVLAHCACSWTIQNESIIIIKNGGVVQDSGLLLGYDNGLISVEIAEDYQSKHTKKSPPKKMTVKTILFPQLVPGTKCKIVSTVKNIDAWFKVRSGKYFGDNRGGDFCCECEVDIV
jgi:hypothetical protein